MATVTPTIDVVSGVPRITWADITTTTDTVTAFPVQAQHGLAGCVQFAGTFAGGSTAVLQGSNDNSAWVTLKDIYGNAISTTAAAMFEFSTAAAYIRPNVTAGAADDVDVIVVLRG